MATTPTGTTQPTGWDMAQSVLDYVSGGLHDLSGASAAEAQASIAATQAGQALTEAAAAAEAAASQQRMLLVGGALVLGLVYLTSRR